jgi:hypothetical protein
MKRALAVLLASALGALCLAPQAQGAFGLRELDTTFSEPDGSPALRAGSHPFAFTTTLGVNTELTGGLEIPEGALKDLEVTQIPGFIGSRTAVPQCSAADFNQRSEGRPACPDATAVGIAAVKAEFKAIPPEEDVHLHVALYNLAPPPGVAARLGFVALNVPISIDVNVNPSPPYNLVAHLNDIPQALLLYGSQLTIWGIPASPLHDELRGNCVGEPIHQTAEVISLGSCPVNVAEAPFLTMPRACTGPLDTLFTATSWQQPDFFIEPVAATTHDDAEPPNPQGMSGCSKLSFSPTISAKPTSLAAESPSGLDFSLNVKDEGLTSPTGLASSDIRKTVVTLPEGFTTNPSLAEGLAVCTEADMARETPSSDPGAGCPNASKVGVAEIETPLLEQPVNGALYIAKPYENPFGSLLALYLVLQNKELGISIKQPLRVETDPTTGRITTVAEELPQLPFSHFRLHFREGTRSPLATPPGCGSYDTEATLYPWSGSTPVHSSSAFQLITGPDAGPCPAGGTPPFHPGLLAGTINNAAGSFSPFNVRLSRTDTEQEITHFSIKLPPGVVAKLAGIPFCPEGAIAAAKAREGQPHGGEEEIAAPSCPSASEIGRTLVGSGVGPSLAYAPGKVYLAGPYHGSQLSIVAITAAKVGPFDLGTVVVREALRINPETAEVFVDATGSDPIPHIVNGIPVHLRDIRVYVDRPQFTLNPTSCEPTSTASTVLGSGLDFGSEADDRPITVTTRFQAADCASLGFKPRLQLRLKGKTRRSGTPALTAILRPRPGDANAQRVSVALPHSEFLDQAHIGTVCTRVQFSSGEGNGAECPARSIYGHARAWTPLFEKPLEGPVFLRSNGGERELPDLVLALHGLIDIDAVGNIDSFKGGIRNTFAFVPDAPVSKVEVALFGGKKGLLENHVDICQDKHFATVRMAGHNGRLHDFRAPLQPQCPKQAQGGRGRHARSR